MPRRRHAAHHSLYPDPDARRHACARAKGGSPPWDSRTSPGRRRFWSVRKQWAGVPDLVVQYSFKVARGLSPAETTQLAVSGITLVDSAHHALFAVKEMAGREVIGTALPPESWCPRSVP